MAGGSRQHLDISALGFSSNGQTVLLDSVHELSEELRAAVAVLRSPFRELLTGEENQTQQHILSPDNHTSSSAEEGMK